MNKYDFLIVGSGISSLTCAALLSKHNYRVLVLEQYKKPGGYMHCFKRFGALFDTGAHYVGAVEPGQPFHTLLSFLGIHPEEIFTPLNQNCFDRFIFPELTFDFPSSYDKLSQSLNLLFPNEKEGIHHYFSLLKSVVQFFPTYSFEDHELNTPKQLEALQTSLESIVNSLIHEPLLKSVLYAHCLLHGVRPQDASFGMHSVLTDSLINGAYGFKNGGDALTEKFIDIIKSNGGEVLTNCRVNKFNIEDLLVKNVETSKGIFSADRVISGAHPKETFSLIDDENLRPAFRERIKKTKESNGVFGIYAVCSENPPLEPLTNYYFFNSSDISSLFNPLTPFDLPPFAFITRPNRSYEKQGQGYPLIIHTLCPYEWVSQWKNTPYGHRPEAYLNFKKHYAEHIIQSLDLKIPGLKKSILKFETSTPLSNLHFNNNPEGSPYGIYHSIDQTGARSFGPPTRIKNLYLTGQSTLFPGLLGSCISGLRTSGYFLGIKPILKELKKIKEDNLT